MTTTLNQFIKDNNIKMTVSEISSRPDLKWDNANHFKCKLKNKNKSITIYYSQGYGIPNDPDTQSVLNALLLDFWSHDMSFSEYCSNYGYSEDSLSALKTFKLCAKNSLKVKKLFNGSLNDFLNCENL
jgi:hypothetical protein